MVYYLFRSEANDSDWQRVGSNPLDMLAHAALSQAAQSTDAVNESS